VLLVHGLAFKGIQPSRRRNCRMTPLALGIGTVGDGWLRKSIQ
jgi:hypothetical protein